MLINPATIGLLQGTAVFGCSAVILVSSLSRRANPSAPYWASFAIAISISWLSLISISLGFDKQLGTVICVFVLTVGVSSLWAGLRSENSRDAKDARIYVIALLSTLVAALGFISPLFEFPRFSVAIIVILCVLGIRECLAPGTRDNVFARAIAFGLMATAAILTFYLVSSFFVSPTAVIAESPSSTPSLVLTAALARSFVALIMTGVACLSAQPLRRHLMTVTRESDFDVVGAEVRRRAEKILAWAHQRDRGLAFILVEIKNVHDMVKVFGRVNFETARGSLLHTLRKDISPMAMIGKLQDNCVLVVAETLNTGDTVSKVEMLLQNLNDAAVIAQESHTLFCLIAFADTRDDGYDWDHLVSVATSRLRPSLDEPLTRGSAS